MVTFELDLYVTPNDGWQAVSFPLKVVNTSVPGVLTPLVPGVDFDVLMWYDVEDAGDHQKHHSHHTHPPQRFPIPMCRRLESGQGYLCLWGIQQYSFKQPYANVGDS